MTRSMKISACLILFLLVYIAGAHADDNKDDTREENNKNLEGMNITLANGEYAPFFSESLKHYGVVSLIVKEAFAEEGIKVSYVFRPWKRGLTEAANGKWHGSVGWVKNEERIKKFYFSEPIMKQTPVFFQRKSNPIPWKTISDLKDVKIAFVTGFFYSNELMTAAEDNVIIAIRSIDEAHSLKMLINRRVDLATVEREVGINLLRTRFNPNEAMVVEPQTRIIHSQDLFMLLSRNKKENKELIQLFNSGLKKLEVNGKVEQCWQESRRGDYIIK